MAEEKGIGTGRMKNPELVCAVFLIIRPWWGY